MRFSDLVDRAKGIERKRLVIANAEKENEIKAVEQAFELGIIEPILTGDPLKLSQYSNRFEVIPASGSEDAVKKAVSMVRDNKADLLLKGTVSTSLFLKGVLNKERGLRGRGVLSHIALLDIPSYTKILFITDGGMCIHPDLKTKVEIIKNAISFAASIGIKKPKVGLLSAVEVVNTDMKDTEDWAVITKMYQRGEIKDAIIDGPLAMDILLSKEAAEIKGINTPVAGDVDVIIVPDIITGNSVAKALLYLSPGVQAAGIIAGASRPVVMLSRADSAETKLNSIILGVVCYS